MGTRQSEEQQEEIWIANGELARSPGHPFYQRLNDLLDSGRFDPFVEGLCRKFYAPRIGRPSLAPGIYSRSLLIGYFEGIDSERDTLTAGTGGDQEIKLDETTFTNPAKPAPHKAGYTEGVL